ncbi:MAG TPA: PQQ-dependent sugar dehydrogenase [Actinomycetota bacterium]
MPARLPATTALLVFALVTLAPAVAAAEEIQVVVDDATFPTNLAFTPDGRLFYTEKQTGLVRVVGSDGRLRDEPFVSVGVRTGGETGLLGIAVHPRFAQGDPWLYLYRSDPLTGMNELVRVRADGDRAAGAIVPLLTTVPATNAYHNGGDLLFGPDGMLYVSVGEAHEPDRAQDVEDLGGKVLRLTPEGAPAPGNPLGAGSPVYTFGHRNSFGLCADPDTGTIWETENGPDRDDEVNRLVPGADYGWPAVTGDSGGRYEDPVSVFGDTVAVTGCAWWGGDLYVGSYKDGAVRRVLPDGTRQDVATLPAGVTDLVVGPDGRLYVATVTAILALGEPAATVTLSPTPAPSLGGSRGALRWLSIGAGVVLAVALGVRWWSGRRLRVERGGR